MSKNRRSGCSAHLRNVDEERPVLGAPYQEGVPPVTRVIDAALAAKKERP